MIAKFYEDSDEYLSVTEILNELKDVLASPLGDEGIMLSITRAGASPLAGLGKQPGKPSAMLWFAGLASARQGVATGRFCLDLEAPRLDGGEATDQRAKVTDEDVLGMIAPLAALLTMIDFAPKNVAPPRIENTEWIMDEQGASIAGHRIIFTIEFCLPPTCLPPGT